MSQNTSVSNSGCVQLAAGRRMKSFQRSGIRDPTVVAAVKRLAKDPPHPQPPLQPPGATP